MQRTTVAVVTLALVAAVVVGVLVGRLAGGDGEPGGARRATVTAAPSPPAGATAPPAVATVHPSPPVASRVPAASRTGLG
jgi:hypothetical protein